MSFADAIAISGAAARGYALRYGGTLAYLDGQERRRVPRRQPYCLACPREDCDLPCLICDGCDGIVHIKEATRVDSISWACGDCAESREEDELQEDYDEPPMAADLGERGRAGL